ncbi:MAG: hypothetical protein M0Q45_11930, partial [Bacteroidales bacterium]|nr:hypothetical protein [Bacteroidales bacterium]
MNRKIAFFKIFVLLLLAYVFSSLELKAQLVYNNGLGIYAKEGAMFYVDGTVQNQDGIINISENAGNNAELIIKNDFINNANAGGDGYYRVYGDWINNNTFNSGSGTVFLQGDNQLISGAVSTYFNNLSLDGTGLKTQTINQYCSGILDLKHLELQNETFTFFMTNTSANAITRTTGFVSALNGGFLSRKTNSNSAYLFPVGSSQGSLRYRPVEIKPTNSTSNTYLVRMANLLSSIEGYDNSAISSDICEVEPDFYHQINRTEGSAAVKLSVFYNETEDGVWDGLADWHTSPDSWEIISESQILTATPLNEAFVNNWNDFSELPYILYRVLPDVSITHPGDFCENDSEITLIATSSGGTWSGNGITNPSTGEFNPSQANIGDNIISYNIGSGTCSDSDQITI